MTMRIAFHYGDTILNIMAGGYMVQDGYYPEVGDPAGTVTEQINVLIRGSSHSDLQNKIHAIEYALEHARRHPSGAEGCYLHFAVDQDLELWRSRIVDGRVLLDQKLDNRWRSLKALVGIIIERNGYWEATEAVNLTTSGEYYANITNHEDSDTGDNFSMDIDLVEGTLPTPAIIEYKNTTNAAGMVDNLYVGHLVEIPGNSIPPVAGLILEGSGTADANCSGGEYAALPWTGEGENELETWSLITTFMDQRHYKFVARFKDTFAYTDLWLQGRLMADTLVLAETRWTLMEASKSLQLIGSMRIPPFMYGANINLGTLTVALYGRRAGGDGTVNLDFIALMPQDGWRHYGALGDGLPYNKTLIDNPVDDYLVTNYLTSYEVTHMVESGQPIMLQPNVKNILYFLHDTADGAAPIARTATVTVKCHPRRSSV